MLLTRNKSAIKQKIHFAKKVMLELLLARQRLSETFQIQSPLIVCNSILEDV